MNIKRVGINLEKQVFQVHGVDHQDKVVLRRQLRRNQIAEVFRHVTTLFDWHGSLWWRASLGALITEAGPYCKTDCAATCEALCEEQQERRQ